MVSKLSPTDTVNRVELLCLVDNQVRRRGLLAEHGLSILIETEKAKVLLDAGQTPKTLFHNARLLKIDMDGIHTAIMTHGHYDHTGSIPKLSSRAGRSLNIVAHPEIFRPKFTVKRGETTVRWRSF
ncbi:MAG: MBL fold metallo-hydrolase [Candidatus Bathyarchaeia archaeon]